MKVLILYDRSSTNYNGRNICEEINNILIDLNHDVINEPLNSDDLKPCTECYECWTNTPGECVIKEDNVNEITKMAVKSDAMIIISKVLYGGFSSDIKAFLNRKIQNVSPYFENDKDNMSQKNTSPSYPNLFVVGYGDVSESESEIFKLYVNRNALNLHSRKAMCMILNDELDMLNSFKQIENLIS